MDATKTAPRQQDWRVAFDQIAAVEANTLRIPLTGGNVFTFATLRRMTPHDVEIVIETLANWKPTLTHREPRPVIEPIGPDEPYALNAR